MALCLHGRLLQSIYGFRATGKCQSSNSPGTYHEGWGCSTRSTRPECTMHEHAPRSWPPTTHSFKAQLSVGPLSPRTSTTAALLHTFLPYHERSTEFISCHSTKLSMTPASQPVSATWSELQYLMPQVYVRCRCTSARNNSFAGVDPHACFAAFPSLLT